MAGVAESLASASLASLGMYDLPELRSANDLLWATLAEHLAAEGVEAPAALTRGRPLAGVWRDPALLLAQTCGYPLMAELRGSVQLVATPRYLAEGCQGPFYRSAIVVAAGASAQTLEDLRGSRCAVNELNSNSGMNLLRAEISAIAGGREFFGHIRLTGAHAASLEVVARGEADVAAIDCVTLCPSAAAATPSRTGGSRACLDAAQSRSAFDHQHRDLHRFARRVASSAGCGATGSAAGGGSARPASRRVRAGERSRVRLGSGSAAAGRRARLS